MGQTLRMTHQREIILQEILTTKMHPTADELYERIKKKLPRISLATVYRNLEILSEAGLIAKLEISGRQKRFDWDLVQHDHFYCVQCQRIENFPVKIALPPVVEPDQEKGYKVTGCRVEFLGICPQCQQRNAKKEKKGVAAMGCKSCANTTLSEQQRAVLSALAGTEEPCGSKEIAAVTGLESKQISCQITALKNKGYVDSPVRCKYQITEQGKTALDNN